MKKVSVKIMAVWLVLTACASLLTGCSGNGGKTESSSKPSAGHSSAPSAVSEKASEAVSEDLSWMDNCYKAVIKPEQANVTLTEEQYSKTKEVMEKRLKIRGAENYKIDTEHNTVTVYYTTKDNDKNIADELCYDLCLDITFRGGVSSHPEELPEIFTADDIEKAESGEQEMDGEKEYTVTVTMNEAGKEKLTKATETYLNKEVTVWMDKDLLATVAIPYVITDGSFIMFNSFGDLGAGRMADILNTGALPVPMQVDSFTQNKKR